MTIEHSLASWLKPKVEGSFTRFKPLTLANFLASNIRPKGRRWEAIIKLKVSAEKSAKGLSLRESIHDYPFSFITLFHVRYPGEK